MSFFVVFTAHTQSIKLENKQDFVQKKWADSILKTLSVEQKIGQLFMIAAYSNMDEKHYQTTENLVQQYQLGGLIFMQGTPLKQAELTNRYQQKSKIPLLIGFDGEWGLSMRLKESYQYPWNMTLGAIRDNDLIEQFGQQLGRQLKRIGVHVNFAPVVDVNTNPLNPIIGNRSFGENKVNVAEKAMAFTKGIQSERILASAKHFPGHGDTDKDSHKTLPTISFDASRIDSVELYPYKKLIESGIGSVMVAHLNVPSLDTVKNIPSTLSYKIVTELLKEKLAYNGLIFTDALNMKGVLNGGESGSVELAAFLAGNDMLLFSEKIQEAIAKIKLAVDNGIISDERLNYSVRKILETKYWVGLNNFKPIVLDGLQEAVNAIENEVLHRKLIENSVTLLLNKDELFPIQHLEKQRIAYVKMGDADHLPFLNMLQNYAIVTPVEITSKDSILDKLSAFNLVIVGYHKADDHPWRNHKLSETELNLLDEIAKKNNAIVSIFANPYSLLEINSFQQIKGLVLAYQNSKLSQEITAQMLFGAHETKGKIPVSVKNEFYEGYGLLSSNLSRLSYGIPEEVGMSRQKLAEIDSIATQVISQEMAPGLQILVAREGKVIFQKSYGFQTYEKIQAVKNTDVYDLASLTKILATLPLLMELEEKGKIELDDKLSHLLPEYRNSNKKKITVKEMLSHHARLQAWIPFYTKTLQKETKIPDTKYYSLTKNRSFEVKVAKNLYLRTDYLDSINAIIEDSKLLPKKEYKYSDLPYYIFKQYIEKKYDKSLDELTSTHFYNALGANRLTYLPLQKMDSLAIIPSEIDTYYRHQILRGNVHDMGAAMQGGVGGHAGLFGNANDVAKMMQLYLQKGFYGGHRYFNNQTIEKFNTRYFEADGNRRALGFDKPQLNGENANTCGCVSQESFGHSGFTGTYAWADPESQIVYVFLSNRTYPTMENNKLIKEEIRTKIQKIIQDAIIK
ncbi:MAG: glycoside hydrolase family 3 N-terminal domain-containing protein [Flavobacteriaceae bacterium]|nr:glycoside hydrolase family 3 N-terminal domain-containing protein [Flavobacteriaceae bacterium]